MIKLALVGKNIQHSKSPEMYKALLGTEINYELLDYLIEADIPKALELLSLYDGINITSPYKKHFLAEIELTESARLVGAVNCLRLKDGIVIGENTDFLAIVNILEGWIEKYKNLNVIVLGDGVMSKVTHVALSKFSQISLMVFSRKTSNHFDQLNVDEIFRSQFTSLGQKLVINTCSRDFVFKGKIDKQTIFWDYNYNFTPHSQSFFIQTDQYVDGLNMLELQARYALSFWSIKSIF